MLSCSRRLIWILIAACGGSTCISRTARAQAATLTLDDIIRGCQATEERWKNLKNWMIHYRHVRDRRVDKKNPMPGDDAEFPPIEKVNGRRGAWFYAYDSQGVLMRHNPHYKPTDKFRYWILWKDGVSLERDEDDVSILPEPSVRAYQMFFFTAWLGLDMQADMTVRSEFLRKIFKSNRPSDKIADAMLPQCLVKHRAEYHVRPELENVDGHLCHVVEWPNHDIIWIDPAINFMTRRRFVFKPIGHLAADVTHVGYEQKAPGIWIPSHSKSLSYHDLTAPEQLRTKVRDVVQNILIDSQFNDVPDSSFTIPIPDGVRIHDFIRGYTYEKRKPDANPLRHGLAQAQFDLSLSARPSSRRDRPNSALLAGIGLQLIVTAFLIGWQKKHRQREEGPVDERGR